MSMPFDFWNFIAGLRRELMWMRQAGRSNAQIARKLGEHEAFRTLISNLTIKCLQQHSSGCQHVEFLGEIYLEIAKVNWSKYEDRSNEQFFGFINTIVSRTVRRCLKRDQQMPGLPPQCASSNSQESARARRMLMQLLLLARKKLTGRKRKAILLCLLEDLEVASQVTGLPIETLKRYLREFRKLLD